MSTGQQPVQLADHPGAILTQRTAAVGQDPQHRQLLVISHRAQPGHPGRGQRHRMRVGGVGLAALPGGEHPGARRQLGRHVHDVLAVGDQPQGDVRADALASLDRPGPLRPVPHRGHHRGVARCMSAIPAPAQHGLVAAHDLDRGGPLMRVHPDHYRAHRTLRPARR
jgi:hypothetical protein